MAQPRRHKKRIGKRGNANAVARTAEARIDSIGARGDGVAIVDGAKVFIPLTAPGDLARIAYRGARGELETLVEPSGHRAEPACPHYGDCGGCALQHINIDYYRNWKRLLVVDALSREGFDEALVAPLVDCAPASRRRAAFAVRRTQAGIVCGFNQRASARIVAIQECLVLDKRLEAALPLIRMLAGAAPSRWRAFDLNVTLCDNGIDIAFAGGDAADDLSGPEIFQLTEIASAGSVIRLTVEGAVIASFESPTIRFGGVAVAVPPGGFLQASAEGEAALRAFVLHHAKGAKRVADLFSGSGTFALPLAGGGAVDPFDSDELAIAALDAAARAGDLRHPLRARQRNLFERPINADELKAYDVVIVDPPRAGARAQAEQLAQSAAPLVIGVSCSPASFARDAAILRAGGYHLSQVLPVDQFVYSPHVELAGVFTKG